MAARMQNISSTAKGSANLPNELILPNSSKRLLRQIFVALLETSLETLYPLLAFKRRLLEAHRAASSFPLVQISPPREWRLSFPLICVP